LVFVREDIDREPEQEAFIARVRGTWESGSCTASFRTPQQLLAAVVRALNELRSAQGSQHTDRTVVVFADDGAIAVESDASADGSMGFMAVSHAEASSVVRAAGQLAEALWGLVEAGDRVRQVAAAVGVPEASNCVYSMSGHVQGSVAIGSAPSPLIAPDPPVIVRRNDLGEDRFAEQLLVPLRRTFADYRAVND
jgi:hypothetical protein